MGFLTVFGHPCSSAQGHCHVNEFSPPSSSLSPDFGAGQQARLALRDPELPATYPCSIPRRLKLTMPSPFSRRVTIIRHFQEHRHFLCRIRSDCRGQLASFDEAPTNVVANMP